MILLSNNLVGKLEFPKGAVVRINAAWLKNDKELKNLLYNTHKSDVFLDFPSGRTKPPKPTLTLPQLIEAIKKHDNIKYFAVSNSEDSKYLKGLKKIIGGVELVPKIETLHGVRNIDAILRDSKCKRIMLDKDDMWVDAKSNTKVYENAIKILKAKCCKTGIKVLELNGVVFCG